MEKGNIIYSIEELTNLLLVNFPEIHFALLFGSAKDGVIKKGSDIDLGVFYNIDFDKTAMLLKLSSFLEEFLPGTFFDIIILNHAGPVLRFEALQGKILFVRASQENQFGDFYTSTCSEYEDKTFWMKKQLEYRGYEIQWGN